jgi:pyrimidine deaminase RibD-like protein
MDDQNWMDLAIEEAAKCLQVESAFNVGAVLVKNGQLIAKGFSREVCCGY